jgi:hypothetical protein
MKNDEYQHILVEEKGEVDWLTLNRPEALNALNMQLVRELSDYFHGLYRRPERRIVVMKAAGRAFCAGLDMAESPGVPKDMPVREPLTHQVAIRDIIRAMRQCPQPIIALVQGAACGGGMSLALASDIRIAGETMKMNAAYIRIGLGNNEDEVAAARQRVDEAYERLNPGLFQQGEDFAMVAREYSEDPETAANGGELPGWIGESEDMLAEIEMHSFHEAVLGLSVDEISRPFEFGGSLYIVQVIERTEPETVDMEEARPFIEEILSQQKHSELEIQLQEQLLEQAEFEIYWPVLESYIQQLPTPVAPFPFDVPIEQTIP